MLGNMCKVLIVEDEYLTRQGIRNMLDWNAEGFEIVGEAGNGTEALALVEKLRPQIVLTDIVMPVMDGLELEKHLRQLHPEIQLIVLSSYSDFAYVRDSFQSGAVDYILKPTLSPEVLLKTMKQVASRIPGLVLHGNQDLSLSRCVEQLLFGFSGNEPLESLRKELDAPFFMLVGMDAARIFSQDAAAVRRQEQMLSEGVESFLHGYGCVQSFAEEAIQLLLINFSSAGQAQLIETLHKMADYIAKKEPRTFYVASEVFADLSLLREVYCGAFIQNADRYFYYKGRCLMTGQDFRRPDETVKFDGAAYAKCLETLEAEKALDLLEEYVSLALAERLLDEMELKTLVQNAWYQLISVFEDQQLSQESLIYLKRDCLTKIHACKYADQFAQVFSVIQSDFRAIIGKYEINAQSSTIRSILRYIDSHFSESLTLASLAKQFNFNYTYLSSYFQAHHKEGFREYLNKERIRHAMDLLRQGALSVSDVCGSVGYTDQSYFTRVFKKINGITPREFRRRHVAERT